MICRPSLALTCAGTWRRGSFKLGRWFLLVVFTGVACACSEELPSGSEDVPAGGAAPDLIVAGVEPSVLAPGATFDLRIFGSGFDAGSRAWVTRRERPGAPSSAVVTNSTHYVSPTELAATVTTAADAAEGPYDVIVVSSKGRQGVGTELIDLQPVSDPDQPPGADPPPSASPAIAIARVSGNDQEGFLGKLLGEPFVVRVTDAQGQGVENAIVTWSVTSGSGVFFSFSNGTGLIVDGIARTDAAGIVQAHFRPTVIGASMVFAEIRGLQGSPVTFTTNADATVWPTVFGSSIIYERTTIEGAGYLSRYVLYDEGVFGLQYSQGFEFPGTYSTGPDGIAFTFSNCSGVVTCLEWHATGTVRGDSLFVRYDLAALLSDFEDGVYVRSR